MHRRFLPSVGVISALLLHFASNANAGIISVDGTLQNVLNARGAAIGTSIDYWKVVVASPGTVSFDIRSWEQDDSTFSPVDLNGDGEFAFIDSHIFLFADDGTLNVSDLLADNDDDDFVSPAGFGDGSVSVFDSFFSTALASGSYILAVAAAPITVDEVVLGIDAVPFKSLTFDAGNIVSNNHGDYRLTLDGDLTIERAPGSSPVPEPSSLILTCLGAIGAGWTRLKRRQSTGCPMPLATSRRRQKVVQQV